MLFAYEVSGDFYNKGLTTVHGIVSGANQKEAAEALCSFYGGEYIMRLNIYQIGEQVFDDACVLEFDDDADFAEVFK